MTDFLVSWSINIDATSPEEAAREALAIHRDPNSIATVFTVRDIVTRDRFHVDLSEEHPGERCKKVLP